MNTSVILRGSLAAATAGLAAQVLYAYLVLCPALKGLPRLAALVSGASALALQGLEPARLARAPEPGWEREDPGSRILDGFPADAREWNAQLVSVLPEIEARFGKRAAGAVDPRQWPDRARRWARKAGKELRPAARSANGPTRR